MAALPPARVAWLLLSTGVWVATAVHDAAAGPRGPRSRLTIVERSDGTGALSLILRGLDDLTTGAAADPRRGMPAGIDATLEVYYTDAAATVAGAWTMPAPWQRNDGVLARFANGQAPSGPTTIRRATIRTGALVTVSAAGLGDGTTVLRLPATPPGPGGVTVVLTVNNATDGSIHRACMRFAGENGGAVELKSKGGTRRLIASGGARTACLSAATVAAADECEVLNAASCLLPYPSSRFLVPAPTATGVRLELPQRGLPKVKGPEVPVAPLNALDGFSPGVQILMHFPQGVDPAASGASRLLPPGCCGQPPGPPWIDTRTYTGRSLDADSPTVLLDADTGERLLHFIELDARAEGNVARQVVFLRPGRILTPGHRYIVAARRLVSPSGAPVVAEPAFAALRDGVPSGVPALERRRAHMERRVLDVLEAHGVPRHDLVLAFDFVVRSQTQLTAAMLSMRDQAYDWLAEVEADPAAVRFTVTRVTEHECTPGRAVWRDVAGTFDSPLFLTAEPTGSNAPFLDVDASGTPRRNGFTHPAFTVSIPCTVLDPGVASHPVLFGHGLGQTGDLFTSVIPSIVNAVVPWNGVAAATDWRGLSGQDLGWVATNVIGVGQSQLHDFQALPARLRQGMLNTLVLARMMRRGLFNRHEAFRTPDGRGVFPGPGESVAYFGVSLGGIMGTYLAGLTPDVERFGLDVGAVNFSCMLQRALPFASFDALLSGIGVTDPIEVALGIGLTHELWAEAEPVSVVHHVRTDPLPGAGDVKRVLYSEAFLDKQVSNQCTEIAARTMGLPSLLGSIKQGLPEIPDLPGPLDSAYVSTHLGELDILNPAHAPFIPPLANLIPSGVCDPHPRRSTVPDSIRQLSAFLLPGGRIVSFCDGLCDGNVPDERPVIGCTP